MNNRLFAAAGVSLRGGLYTFRGTNRTPAVYEAALYDVGDDDCRFVELPHPMTKLEAKAYCAKHERFADIRMQLEGRGVTALGRIRTPIHTQAHTVVSLEGDALDEYNAPKLVVIEAPKPRRKVAA
jgi:hypothetical protein